MTIAGKSALITGSLGGIGFATAKALAQQGCDITLNAFARPETIDARIAELQDMGVRAQYHPADLRQPQIADMIDTTQKVHGGLDTLATNAAVPIDGPSAAGR